MLLYHEAVLAQIGSWHSNWCYTKTYIVNVTYKQTKSISFFFQNEIQVQRFNNPTDLIKLSKLESNKWCCWLYLGDQLRRESWKINEQICLKYHKAQTQQTHEIDCIRIFTRFCLLVKYSVLSIHNISTGWPDLHFKRYGQCQKPCVHWKKNPTNSSTVCLYINYKLEMCSTETAASTTRNPWQAPWLWNKTYCKHMLNNTCT